MKKLMIASFLVGVVALNASTVAEAFSEGSVSGEIRLGYIQQENESNPNSYATALGGILKYETAPWNDFKLGVAGYISQKVPFTTGTQEKLNPDFFDADGDSFVYVGEAYMEYADSDVTVRLGRLLIDTPFLETDDVRMLPNTFEGAMAMYHGIEKTTLSAGYLQRWAGFDSPRGHTDSINEFKKFGENHDSNGVFLLGGTNESIDNLALQVWGYRVDKVTDALYTDAAYTLCLSETAGIKFAAQYATFDEKEENIGVKSGIDGSVYGLGVNVNVGMLTLGVAMNRAFNDAGKYVMNGLGGGPYYTSMEEMTIDGMEDATAYQVSSEVDMALLGVEGLTFTALYGEFKSTPMDAKITEMDIVVMYHISETLSTDVSYAKIEDRNNNFDAGNDAGYSRLLARLNYKF
jgi:hypothetical protein